MRDAFGGLVNLAIIVVFMVIVSGYLAFNVNYTKAFKAKNKIIDYYEQYTGNCNEGSECYNEISSYLSEIGYKKDIRFSNTEGYECKNGYCVQKHSSSKQNGRETIQTEYYEVKTYIIIDIPIINKIMPQFDYFTISGATETYVIK